MVIVRNPHMYLLQIKQNQNAFCIVSPEKYYVERNINWKYYIAFNTD